MYIHPALLALALVGCRSHSLAELGDAMRDANIRCLVAEPDMIVGSPFGLARTDALLAEVRMNLDAIEALLEVDVPPSLVVLFAPIEMPNAQVRTDGDILHLEGFERPAHHGVVGFASGSLEEPTVTIYVAPAATMTMADGQQVSIMFDFDSSKTIRHELTHVAAKLARLDGPTWFNEGIALELEFRERDPSGALVPSPLPLTLRVARDEHGPFSVDDVIDWREDGGRVHAGEETAFQPGRPLAHALLRFLLERQEGASLRERLERIEAMDPQSIRALGSEWKAWLEALPRGE